MSRDVVNIIWFVKINESILPEIGAVKRPFCIENEPPPSEFSFLTFLK